LYVCVTIGNLCAIGNWLIENQGIVIAVLAGSHIYKRVSFLRSLANNEPGHFQAVSAFPWHEIKYADQLKNCEDVVLLDDSEGWALLSCDAGRDNWNTVMVSKIFM
jgi:arylesterase/paraoxonase